MTRWKCEKVRIVLILLHNQSTERHVLWQIYASHARSLMRMHRKNAIWYDSEGETLAAAEQREHYQNDKTQHRRAIERAKLTPSYNLPG
jgi:hypothetical protein